MGIPFFGMHFHHAVWQAVSGFATAQSNLQLHAVLTNDGRIRPSGWHRKTCIGRINGGGLYLCRWTGLCIWPGGEVEKDSNLYAIRKLRSDMGVDMITPRKRAYENYLL